MRFHSCAAVALTLACAASALRGQGRTLPPANDTSTVAYDDDGLRIHSTDRRKQLKIKAYVVADARAVLNDTTDAPANGFALRRSRVTFDANMFPGIAARVMYDVGAPSGPSPVQDAYVDVGLGHGWWMRAGKQKTPIGLERYMSISAQLLPERSIASNLHAGRDVGVLVTGPLADDRIEVALGLFDGAADGGSTQDTDPNDAKDLTYRIWFKPVRTKVRGVEQGFGFAYNGTTGMEKSPLATGAKLPTFKTPAQISFFSYAEAQGVRADGRHTRNGVFSYYHTGPIGVMGEWFSNSQVVSRAASVATVHTGGWVANLQYSLSGELSAQEGLSPREPFDPEKGNWGAWQIGGRVSGVDIGKEAFPLYVDSTVAPHNALEVGVGLNWYLTRVTKAQLAYESTSFQGGAKVGDRKTERYLLLRWQEYF